MSTVMPNTFRWGFESITFQSGDTLTLPLEGLIAMIGPNNSGKSTVLHQIVCLTTGLHLHRERERIVSDVTRFRHGSEADARAWLDMAYPTKLEQHNGGLAWSTIGGQLPDEQFRNTWRDGNALQGMHQFLVHRLDSSLHRGGQEADSIDLLTQQPSAYIHVLQRDEELMRKVSAEVKAAFGVGLVINWGSTRRTLHMGDEPLRTVDRDRVSLDYVKEVAALPTLSSAGDGIRCFVSCLLALECGSHPVLIIDEPEAFLAPPQARRLGRLLGLAARERNRQLIVATHDSDLIQGALSTAAPVTIARVTRDGNMNRVFPLSNDRLRELTRKPMLRSAAAISGVFHQGVVICEGDADCRFYQSLLERLETRREVAGPVDLYFVPCGGKGELPTVANAYKSLNVPTAVIADLDLLKNETELMNVVNGLLANYEEFRKTANEVRAALSDRPPVVSVDTLLEDLQKLTQELAAARKVRSEHKRLVSQLFADAGDWSEAKKYGIQKLSGGALTQAKALLEKLAAIGLFLIPCGELERWWRDGPASGKTPWFIAAMQRMEDETVQYLDAEVFVARVSEFFGRTTTLDTSRWLGV